MTHSESMTADNQYTIILGAEGEMGRAMAREIARKGCHLLLVSTSKADLQRFAIGLQLKEEVTVDAVKLRLEERDEVLRFVERVKEQYEVRALINNITCDWSARNDQCLNDMDREKFMARFQGMALIVTGLLPVLTRLSASYIQHIIPMPFRRDQLTPDLHYAIVKMVAYARGMEEELRNTPVSVSILHPAPIRTMIPRISEEGELTGQEHAMTPATVAIKAVNGMLRGDRRIIPGFWNKVSYYLHGKATSWIRNSTVSFGSNLQPSV
jgi:short-subunit dehydrogenase